VQIATAAPNGSILGLCELTISNGPLWSVRQVLNSLVFFPWAIMLAQGCFTEIARIFIPVSLFLRPPPVSSPAA